MNGYTRAVLGAATVVAALGVVGCSGEDPTSPPSVASPVPSATPSTVSAPLTAPLPAPETLTDVLSRLADPGVPGVEKVTLIEGTSPESAAVLDSFTTAMRDSGYLPVTFAATNIEWSDKNSSDVIATINVTTSRPDDNGFAFPMEFTPFHGGWQLTRRTAEMLLALGSSEETSTLAPAPEPNPTPEPAPTSGG